MNKTIEDFTIICPYIHREEIQPLQEFLGWKYNVLYEEDKAKIGSDLMYQGLWNKCDNDIFIIHADMSPVEEDWADQLLGYVNKYPEAGMIGCKLLYPVKDQEGKTYIQSAGGYFEEDGTPQHYGSGLDVVTGSKFKETEYDEGQYDYVREVAWTTFGGIYIRREVIDSIGDFDPAYEWSYNRDVDYCLQTRENGYKIYQVPVVLNHFESKDNKRLRATNPEMNFKEMRNLETLKQKWKDKEVYKTIDNRIDG